MDNIPTGEMVSNRGLEVGAVVTEIRSHPFLIHDGDRRGKWSCTHEVLRFEVIDVCRAEYKCRYVVGENERDFYWSFWDRQPNCFLPNGSSTVSYYAPNPT